MVRTAVRAVTLNVYHGEILLFYVGPFVYFFFLPELNFYDEKNCNCLIHLLYNFQLETTLLIDI